MQEKFTAINNLKSEFDGLLKSADEKRVSDTMQEVRLELNYTSNNIEGGTLTKEEIAQLTTDSPYNMNFFPNRPRKDIYEMITHDKVVISLLSGEYNNERITENFIRGLHRELMYEPYDIKKRQSIGKWKKKPNEVINYRNEKMTFCPPEEVPKKMNELINWLDKYLLGKRTKSDADLHPIVIAAEFHLKYVTIHPFYDGNGRTARLLMNIILDKFGLPPIIVAQEDKHEYHTALAHAQEYEQNPQAFHELLADLLTRSMQRTIGKIKGENMEEYDSLDKKIKLHLIKYSHTSDLKEEKSKKTVQNTYKKSFKPLFQTLTSTFKKFKPLFRHIETSMTVDSYGNSNKTFDLTYLEDKFLPKPKPKSKKDNDSREVPPERIGRFNVDFRLRGYIKAGRDAFDMYVSVHVDMHDFKYDMRFQNNQNKPPITRMYNEFLSDKEIKTIANDMGNELLKGIEANMERIKTTVRT
ncbi:MAG TPA: Fic family protein [Bacteroidia bacterium]|jgi:Fic family protein|nr:Fic family protein [Bacteroidia bacterium]